MAVPETAMHEHDCPVLREHEIRPTRKTLRMQPVAEASDLNRPGFTGGQNSRRIARYGTDAKEEDLEAVFA